MEEQPHKQQTTALSQLCLCKQEEPGGELLHPLSLTDTELKTQSRGPICFRMGWLAFIPLRCNGLCLQGSLTEQRDKATMQRPDLLEL